MKHNTRNTFCSGLSLLVALMISAGCESGGSGGGGDLGDVGSNDANVYVTLGDSITDGNNGGGAPYPPRLADMSGKTVIDRANQNQSSGDAVGMVNSVLADTKPGALLFMLGSVDLINGRSIPEITANLRTLVQQAKANKTVPVVATLTPMLYSHARWADAVKELNKSIRDMASSEGARVANMESRFGSGEGLILEDGLHPNDKGNQIMAEVFNDAL
jgi:lysophospholipase L1-like esterase